MAVTSKFCSFGLSYNQINFSLVQRKYLSSINLAKTRSYPGASIYSDHNLVLMLLRLKLWKHQDNKNHRLKFDITKLQNPNVNSLFKAHKGGRFASLLYTNPDALELTTEFTETITKAAQDFLGK